MLITLYDFVMGDMYTYTRYLTRTIMAFVAHAFSIPPPIAIIKAVIVNSDNSRDITKDYVTSRKWTANTSPTDLVHVTWSFESRTYAYAFQVCDPIEFPPYTLEKLRGARPSRRIIAASIDGDTSAFPLVSEYAGPLHNFYEDVAPVSMQLNWIYPDALQLDIIDSFGKPSTLGKNDELQEF